MGTLLFGELYWLGQTRVKEQEYEAYLQSLLRRMNFPE
jgi:hypothetical protein